MRRLGPHDLNASVQMFTLVFDVFRVVGFSILLGRRSTAGHTCTYYTVSSAVKF